MIQPKLLLRPKRAHLTRACSGTACSTSGHLLTLAPEVLSAIGILTTDDVAGTDLAVLCLGDGTVEIAPTQLRLRAMPPEPEAYAGIAEALSTAETPPSIEIPEHQMVLGGTVDRDTPKPNRLRSSLRSLAGVVEPELECGC